MSLNFPIVFISESRNLFGDFKHCFRVFLCNSAKHINGVDSNVDTLVGKTNKSIVEEDIKPLLIKLSLLLQNVCLAAIDELIISEIFFKVLDNPDSQLHVMGGMCVNKFANLLPFIRAFFN